MATIKSQLMLTDAMTAPLKRITKALNLVISSFDTLQRETGSPLDLTSLNKAKTELDLLGKELDDLEDKANQSGNAFGSLVKSLGLLAVAKKGFDSLKAGVEYASDLAEVQNVVDVTFGSSAAQVNDWAKTTLDAYGLNEQSALRFSGTMGAMLKSSGLSGDAVVDMSQKITELAGDMASFYNLEGEEAFNKLRSGISGETEPLKQLGINMSVANLEAYALAQGIETSYNEMSQAEQVMLRYNYLLNTTKDAQGDFARTSDSFSNQTKLLSENWKQFTGQIVSGLLPVLAQAISGLNATISFLSENWSIIGPIVAGLIGIIGAYVVALGIYKGAELAAAAAKAFSTLTTNTHAAAQMMSTGATFAATAAQYGFNAALLACPLTRILIIIIAVIAAIYAIIAAINKCTGSTISATGVIVGALMSAVAFIWNLFLGLLDIVLAVVNWIWNKWAAFANFFANLFNDPIGSIIHLFGDMADNVLGIIESIAKAIDKVFGSNLAGAVQGWRSGLSDTVDNWAKKYGNGTYEKVMEEVNFSSESLGLSRWAYSDAYNTGYEWGAGAESSVTDMFNAENMASDIATTAENTSSIANSTKNSDEDLAYLRDIAEMEAINRFTTAEVKIDMTGMTNRIDSSMDLDGVLTVLTEGFAEALEVAAEGVHS